MRDVVVVGAGLHRYGVFPEKNAIELGTVAIHRALDDAGCQWTDIEALYCGTVRLGMSAGHNICRHMGTTGLAITNVENASASGSSAFREAYLAVAAGEHDVVLALILWQMRRVAGPRQIPQDVYVALAHMVGAGGVCVIHMLRQ